MKCVVSDGFATEEYWPAIAIRKVPVFKCSGEKFQARLGAKRGGLISNNFVLIPHFGAYMHRHAYFKRLLIAAVSVGVFHCVAGCGHIYQSPILHYDVPRQGGGVVDKVEISVQQTERQIDPWTGQPRSGEAHYNITINGRKATAAERAHILNLVYIPRQELYGGFADNANDYFSAPFGDAQLGIRPKS
jgi:hypothetical protein